MHKADYYSVKENKIHCVLCPHNCILSDGERGKCRVRKNFEGVLLSENYGKISAIHFDPVEKKPLHHFFPGSRIISIGTIGCNMDCDFCQNCEISQSTVSEHPYMEYLTPTAVVKKAISDKNNIGIAFTYNEPFVWYEFATETAELAKDNDLKNVFVTNGYINPGPFQKILENSDAFNVDLKGFSENFYQKYTRSDLKPVLNTLRNIRKAEKHLEITNLIIPGLNDDPEVFENMIHWIVDELGKETILHLSRYFPMNRMTIKSTGMEILRKLYETASQKLDFVYIGNIQAEFGKNTICPSCGSEVIKRDGYHTETIGLGKDGHCLTCGKKIAVMK